ncbi:xanthine dehydrogenase accessory protein XdhC [Poseidonocella sedimentorum]|uniref:Molybdenum cofactor sulfurylase n=1 Tax=Poseidonocella sedimentorum TaxID=871652 RepID=A0A1I6EA16_9RHOB|nr:xanthine dehydrogenase accessory protein XdhC [Poseidonocella sedimentorum]SFR14401.1 molybdenum cofactor sulfurylase [Poseidonocella sedimentorum]
MSFDLDALRRAIAAHGPVSRVVIVDVAGSSPREVGASMLVWEGGQSGTIGGGTLEWEAAIAARSGALGLSRHALGPDLGQCCGGAVSLLTERWTEADLDGIDEIVARPAGSPTDMPLTVRRLLDRHRAQGEPPTAQLLQGWFIEPVHRPARALWIWGAGHVGRAMANVFAPFDDFAITWVDTDRARFPEAIPDGVTCLPAADPVRLVPRAPTDAEHLILTYAHELDLALCHALLQHGFAGAGLIGSETKWARFRKRLRNLGHSDAQISCIRCPIGHKSLGKHPQAIAVGTAAVLLGHRENGDANGDGQVWQHHSSTSGA